MVTLHANVIIIRHKKYEIHVSNVAVNSHVHELYYYAFYACATDRYGGGIMFSGCSSVSASVRECVRACVLLALGREFHQTLVHDVVEAIV